MGEPKMRKAGVLKTPRSFLLYGIFKRGKTTFAASIIDVPKFKRVLLIDIDLGAAAIGEDFPDVDVWEFERGDIAGFQKAWANGMKTKFAGWDAVIVDTVTVLQSWLEASLPKSDGFQKWADIKKWTLDLMWDLQEMHPVGIATFHTEMANVMKGLDDDDDDVVFQLVPSLQGKAKMSIGAIPDVIGYFEIQEDEQGENIYTAQWAPTEATVTGNRFKNIPTSPMKTDGGMKRLYEYIQGTPNKKKDSQ